MMSIPSETLEVGRLSCQGEEVLYTIRYGGARRVHPALRIIKDGRIDVLLPPGMPAARGHALLRERADWVLHQLQRLRLRRQTALPPERIDWRYVLGTPCRVERLITRKWHGVTWRLNEMPHTEGRILISAASSDQAEALLLRWYADQTQQFCTRRLEALCPLVPWVTDPPPLRVRQMRRRWGSCSSRGVITLAAKMFRLPIACIDYVLLHELTHLHVFNHSPAFYAALATLLPDWQTRRRQLEAFPAPWDPALSEKSEPYSSIP